MRGRILSCTMAAVLVSAALAWAADVQVCHVPPGNPGNAHTITVSEDEVQGHLKHGDQLGSCGGVDPCASVICPAPESECQVAVCSGGICSILNKPDGTPCTSTHPTVTAACLQGICKDAAY